MHHRTDPTLFPGDHDYPGATKMGGIGHIARIYAAAGKTLLAIPTPSTTLT